MAARRLAMLGAALAAGILAAGARGAPGPDAPGPAAGPQEAEVTGVVVDPATRQGLVVLQGKRDHRTVAMAIGPFEATGIAVPLHGLRPPRPLTHDLLLTVIGRLKASVTRIVITDLRDDVFYARVHLDAGGTPLEVDSRPSDAIALALRAGVPILVEDRVFDKAPPLPRPGVTPPL